MSEYKILVDGNELKDAFDIHVKLGMSKLRLSTFALPNNEGQHNNLKLHDSLEVSLGSPLKKYFGGRIETLENLMEEGDYLFVEGFGHGSSLFDAVLTEKYENVNGKEIIKDAIALTDLSDAMVDPNDEIATNFTREYDREPAFDVVQEICKQSAKSDGVVGFYFLVDVSKVVHVYPFDKFTFGIPIQRGVNMSFLRRKRVACTIKNKIWQLGASKRKLPIGGDEYTETLDINNDATNDWKSDSLGGVVSLVEGPKFIGSYSIQLDCTENVLYGRLWLDLPSGYHINANEYPSINFALQIEKSFEGTCDVMLGNVEEDWVVHWFTISKEEFFFKSIRCGEKNPEVWEGSEGFDWSEITNIFWDCHFDDIGKGKFWVDGFFFNNRRFEAEAKDQASINEFGEKPWKAPLEDKLESDAECLIVAKEWLKRKMNPSKILEVGTDGLFDVVQGYRIPIKDLLVHNIDELVRILEVDHFLTNEEGLGTTLDVSLEPIGFSPELLVISRRLKELDEGLKRRVF